MAARTTPMPLGPILQHLRSEPSRTWSIVITVFGDAVMPRGGAVSLTTLLGIFLGMQIEPGVVRTAISRLVTDGWLHRTRLGRHSFYRLTDTGRSRFAPAAERIYGASPTADGTFTIVCVDDGARQAEAIASLRAAGFGSLAPGVWIAPLPTTVPPGAAALPRMTAVANPGAGPSLAARAWDLGATKAAYGRFAGAFGPLHGWIAAGGEPSAIDALVGRILLIHQYRRIVLRDPRLPAALLPADWPGAECRAMTAAIYAALLPASETWLDVNGFAEEGSLPANPDAMRARFAPAADRVTGIR